MSRRIIAAVLMLALCGAGAFAQSADLRPATRQSAVQTLPAPKVEIAGDHRCCHSSAAPTLEIALPPMPEGMPCGDRHSCCVRPVPASSPNLPSVSSPSRPAIHRGAVPLSQFDQSRCRFATITSRNRDVLPYGLFSTVLRI